jgi:trk system potassium uptake protein TrkA|tara:strand:- start:32865 stop:33554 length:690 start_codon:yes stop_codon:yes gene_type:complete
MPANSKDSRPIAVLGLGRFGQRMAERLSRGGEDVLACDYDRDVVEQIATKVAQAVVLDVTDEAAMRSRGVHKVKAAVIGIGEDFEAAVLTTVILRQMEVPRIIARARTTTTAEVLRRVGAHDVVLAEDEAADRWANRLLGPKVLNQIEFHQGYSIIEFQTPKDWVGKGLAELDVRKKLNLHVVAVKRNVTDDGPNHSRIVVLRANEPLEEDDVLIIMGRDEDLNNLMKD